MSGRALRLAAARSLRVRLRPALGPHHAEACPMPAGPSPPAQGQVRPLRAPGHPRLPGGRPGALVAGGSRDLRRGHLAAGAFRSSRGLLGPFPGLDHAGPGPGGPETGPAPRARTIPLCARRGYSSITQRNHLEGLYVDRSMLLSHSGRGRRDLTPSCRRRQSAPRQEQEPRRRHGYPPLRRLVIAFQPPSTGLHEPFGRGDPPKRPAHVSLQPHRRRGAEDGRR
jgi:hypothetical protein